LNLRHKKNNYGLEEYKIHFDKYNTEDIRNALEINDGDEENPFWIAAKNELNEDDYIKLKKYVNGRGKNIHKYN